MFLPQILNPFINSTQMNHQSWTTLVLIPVILVASMPSLASFFHQPTLAEPARGVGTDFPCSLPSGYSELPSPLTCQELAQAHSLCELQLSLGPHCSFGFLPIQSEVGHSFDFHALFCRDLKGCLFPCTVLPPSLVLWGRGFSASSCSFKHLFTEPSSMEFLEGGITDLIN